MIDRREWCDTIHDRQRSDLSSLSNVGVNRIKIKVEKYDKIAYGQPATCPLLYTSNIGMNR